MHSRSIYIHWPFCLAKCPYCDFNSHVRSNIEQTEFAVNYLREIDFFYYKFGKSHITSIFFGGGTPSLMKPEIVDNILNHLSSKYDIAKNAEITLEANPTSFEMNKFRDFNIAGINRVSLGIQSFDAKDLKFLGRQHSKNEAVNAIKQAMKIYNNVSFDLIYARPQQTIQNWQKELKYALSFGSNHISMYQLTIEKGTKFFSDFRQNKFTMPDDELSLAIYRKTNEIMIQHNYINYEISNYAKAGYESKHNMTYWQYGDYIGIGAGAHSRINKQAIMMIHHPENWANQVKNLGHGIQLKNTLKRNEIINEILLMGLRTNVGVNKNRFKELLGVDYNKLIDTNKIDSLKQENLLIETANNIILTTKGQEVINSIIKFLSK